jgi:hypothetical protein
VVSLPILQLTNTGKEEAVFAVGIGGAGGGANIYDIKKLFSSLLIL